ncbi:MAG TPA: NAD-dependent protein deacetylase [Nocardioidaceae bacterium]|nr:NAD-dependent protein deacetylase [Nocardioidaceae bacterium]
MEAETTKAGPTHQAMADPVEGVARLADFVARHRRLFVLTGAGVSTGSGIPDYRDLDGSWKRRSPIELRDFVHDPLARSRYWARSLIGWRSFGAAEPNAAHRALARLEALGRIGLLVTQNVDGLHQAAGSHRVLDLHGRLDRVVCRDCGLTIPRWEWQQRLGRLNPGWLVLNAAIAPDGDADLEGLDFETFDVPDCPRCGGLVKPDVVFFGESVPAWRHERAMAALASADSMLVVGSSLMVFSGFRYARAAAAAGKPIAAVNLGRTRADDLLTLKVRADVGEALTSVADQFGATVD